MKRFSPILTLIAVTTIFFLPATVFADTPEPFLINPIRCPDLLCLLTQVIRIFLGGIAVFATFMFIYGGFVFLTSGGNPDRVKQGKETLFWATVGIVTVLGSWVAIQFVLQSITKST